MAHVEYFDGREENKLLDSLEDVLAFSRLKMEQEDVKSVKIFKPQDNEPCPCGSDVRYDLCCKEEKLRVV